MTRGYMYRIFGRQQFNHSTRKSAYITYHFPKWQCVKVNYSEESVPNRKYVLRTYTTIQNGEKNDHFLKISPQKLIEQETNILLKAYIILKFWYEEKCTEVFKICNSTIQPQKAQIWYPHTKLWWYNQRTAYTIKKLWHEDICTEFLGDSNSTIQPEKARI